MLKKYRKDYINKNVQFVLVDPDGRILESDETLLPMNKGSHIGDIHPFFTVVSTIQESADDITLFNCVALEIGGKQFISDVELTKKSDGVLVMIHDLTEHYVAYQAMAQARNESIINSELIVLKNLELEERERFKNQFIQNFSHELRNPLTSAISITNIIGDTKLSDEQKKMVDFLKDSNSNLKLMLDDILSISMIATGRIKLNNTVFSLLKLLELLEFTYKTKTKKAKLEFKLVSDGKIPEFVEGDRLRLFQVLTNLLDNACKYTEKGNISLEVQLNQKRANKVSLRFQVSDTGVGIPQESLTPIFESFSQLNANQRQEGVGLGLSIVKGLLSLMNSEIKVKSNVGEGSVFFFDLLLTFPLQTLSTQEAKVKDSKLEIKLPKSERKYKILLVEDDERVQMALFKSLMDTGRFYIDVVYDGALVMEEVLNNPYDLIIMDVNLPNVDGDNITSLIRDFPFNNIKNLPIIGITANAFEESLEKYKNVGMNAVMTKPFDRGVLLKTIFKLLK